MAEHDPGNERSRETRLLVGTVAVAGAALLLLAQFRFPGENRPAAAPAAPLERLAARATYDELAAIMATLQASVTPGVAALRVRGSAGSPGGDPGNGAYVPALRVADDLALARVGHDWSEIEWADGAPATVVARDYVRGLVAVRVRAGEAPSRLWRTRGDLSPPAYVGVVEASRAGPMVRPLFVARTDPVEHPEWDEPLVSVGGAAVAQPGSLLFSLDGRFVGIVVPLEGGAAAIPSAALEGAAGRLAAGDVGWSGDIGVRLVPLLNRLTAATGAAQGAVVASVDPQGPAAGRLRIGDVVRAVGGREVSGPAVMRSALARQPRAAAVTLTVVRRGAAFEVEVPLMERPPVRGEEGALGITWREMPGVGLEVVRVESRTAGAAAGLRPGDVLSHLDGEAIDDGRTFQREFAAARAPLLLGVRRGDARIVLVLEPR